MLLNKSKTLHAVWVYLIQMNNKYWAVRNIKDKKSLIKAWTVKQSIFAEESRKFISFRTIKTKETDSLKSCNATLINIKDNDILIENCFVCHKSDHTSKKCSNKSRVNALKEEKYDHSFNFKLKFDSVENVSMLTQPKELGAGM